MNTQFSDLAGEFHAMFPDATAPKLDEAEVVREMLRNQRMERFKAICPSEFRKPIDRSLLPNVKAWDAADKWAGAFPGIWLWSHETGRAKTRMLWRQFGRLHVGSGKMILKASGQCLAEEYFSAHMDGEPRAFYRWAMKHDIVMIDDIDKLDTSDARAAKMLRELFDCLYSENKPVLATSNEPIAFFERKIGASTARRMREVCVEVCF